MSHRTYPRFKRCESASAASSRAKSANRKTGTKHEDLLRKTLWSMGLRYRRNHKGLPGVPDIVFSRERLAIFCDGDFWHGRNWEERRAKLATGQNSAYWIAKIERNIERAFEVNRQLREAGWTVIRLWETDTLDDLVGTAHRVESAVRTLRRERGLASES